MKHHTLLACAAAALLSAATAASAANMAPSSHSGMARPGASDTLQLNTTQQKTAWNDLKTPSLNQSGPSGFAPTVGAEVPASVSIAPMPRKAAKDISALRPYDFAYVGGKVLIVNPSDKKIVDVISG